MAVIKELIRTEADGSISFGNYELEKKSKVSDFEHEGDLYKVKTFKEITKLERNGMFVYESVPGTVVTQITVELETDTEYEIKIGGAVADHQKTNLGGKLSFSVELAEKDDVAVQIEKVTQ